MDTDVTHETEKRLVAIEDQLGLAHDGSGPVEESGNKEEHPDVDEEM